MKAAAHALTFNRRYKERFKDLLLGTDSSFLRFPGDFEGREYCKGKVIIRCVEDLRLGSVGWKQKMKRNSELLTTLYMLRPSMGRMIKSG